MSESNDLKEMRTKAGLTMEKMGDELGLSRPAISYAERLDPANKRYRLYLWAYYGVLSSLPKYRPEAPDLIGQK